MKNINQTLIVLVAISTVVSERHKQVQTVIQMSQPQQQQSQQSQQQQQQQHHSVNEEQLKQKILTLQQKIENVTTELLTIQHDLSDPSKTRQLQEQVQIQDHQLHLALKNNDHHSVLNDEIQSQHSNQDCVGFLNKNCRMMQSEQVDNNFRMRMYEDQNVDILDIMGNKYIINQPDSEQNESIEGCRIKGNI